MIQLNIKQRADLQKPLGFVTVLFFFTNLAFAQATVPAGLASAISKNIPQTIIVLFNDNAVQQAAQSTATLQGIKLSDAAIMAQMRSGYATLKANALNGLPTGISQKADYANLPMTALIVSNSTALSQLVARSDVTAVYENIQHQMVLAESLPLIKADVAQSLGKKGAGTTVAVLDTGVDYSRPAFNSCTAPNSSISCRVVVAIDFAPDDGSRDDNGHGTNVSGIVAGVAPDAKIAGLDVFTGSGAWTTDIISAIDWVIANKQQYNIVSMNLSIGWRGSNYATECSDSWASTPFAKARAVGVLPVVATGNDGFSNGVSLPACTPGAVRVGAVFDYSGLSDFCSGGASIDKVTCFSNSAPSMVTLLAPGSIISAAGITMSGTSQATPHVAGAVAVLRAADTFPGDSLDGTVNRMIITGVPIIDTRNNVTVSRLNLEAAINLPPSGTPNLGLTIQILNDDDNRKRP